MKRRVLFCTFALLISFVSFAQRDSLFMYDIGILPRGGNIKVFLYTEDGRICAKEPFGYFNSDKKKLSSKQLPKGLKIKLKRNKKFDNDFSYIFKYKGMKGVYSYANYSPKRNEYLFFTPLDGYNHYRIERLDFEYEDTQHKKLKNIKVIYRSFVLGTIKIRDYKQ